MSEHLVKIPYRVRTFPLPDGTHQINININGRLSLSLNYDPRTRDMTEVPISTLDDIETKSHFHHG
jgi:hypothetical protein